MHRITVVTTSCGHSESEAVCTEMSTAPRSSGGGATTTVIARPTFPPASPVPGLELASDDSSGGDPATPTSNSTDSKRSEKESSWSNDRTKAGPSDDSLREGPASSPKDIDIEPRRPIKVSNWRRRGISQLPLPNAEYSGIDLSVMKSRDLPIKLVVDDPMPVGKNYGDLHSDATIRKYFKLGEKKRRSRKKGRRKEVESLLSMSAEAESETSSNEQQPMGEKHEEETKEIVRKQSAVHQVESPLKHSPTEQEVKESAKVDSSEGHAIMDSKRGRPEDIVRCNGPVVRVQYEGEMISVSEQTAVKLQEGECDWI